MRGDLLRIRFPHRPVQCAHNSQLGLQLRQLLLKNATDLEQTNCLRWLASSGAHSLWLSRTNVTLPAELDFRLPGDFPIMVRHHEAPTAPSWPPEDPLQLYRCSHSETLSCGFTPCSRELLHSTALEIRNCLVHPEFLIKRRNSSVACQCTRMQSKT